MDMRTLAREARAASRTLLSAPAHERNLALALMADALDRRAGEILEENAADVAAARKKGVRATQLDRLLLDEHRISEMSEGLRLLAKMPDPVGEIERGWETQSGLSVEVRRVPFGVVGVVYESHPNVTVAAAALCIKAANAVVLRGGSLAYASNRILAEVITGAVLEAGFPAGCIQFVADQSRDCILQLLRMDGLVDLVVARGGPGLRDFVLDNSRVPVIVASVGNCHVYVDRSADLDEALAIVLNAKAQRPGLCNACETLLVHEAVAEAFLPRVIRELQDRRVTVYACERTRTLMGGADQALEVATAEHFARELLGPELAIRVVSSMTEAIEHVSRYGTGHSETIVTTDLEAARRFSREVDVGVVYVNAAMCLTGGECLGLGVDLGVSTQKLHARGPLTARELTTYRYVIVGNGRVR